MPEGGFGFVCKIDVVGVPTAIAHINSFGTPEFEKMVAEITGHDADGGYAEWVSTGKRKMGEFTHTLAWDPISSTHAALLAGYNSDDPVQISIEDPSGKEKIEFDAHITKVGRKTEQEEGYMCEVTFQPTGKPTITVTGSI